MTRQGKARRVVAVAVVCWLVLGTAGTGWAQAPQQVIRQVRFDQKLNEPLPLDLQFKDETGRTVRLRDYFGKRPVVLALVYYECPMLCTLILNGLVKSLKPISFKPGEEFDVVVVSFNPRETPELAAKKKQVYLKEYGKPETGPGWHFLTGEQESIRQLTESVGFHYTYDPESNQYAHASGIMVATPQGKLYRYFYGMEYAPRDLRLALVEASQNKIGTPVDALLLYCFHYDPTTGKYGVLIQRVIRLAGGLTVLGIGILLFVFFRRDRRQRSAERHQEADMHHAKVKG